MMKQVKEKVQNEHVSTWIHRHATFEQQSPRVGLGAVNMESGRLSEPAMAKLG